MERLKLCWSLFWLCKHIWITQQPWHCVLFRCLFVFISPTVCPSSWEIRISAPIRPNSRGWKMSHAHPTTSSTRALRNTAHTKMYSEVVFLTIVIKNNMLINIFSVQLIKQVPKWYALTIHYVVFFSAKFTWKFMIKDGSLWIRGLTSTAMCVKDAICICSNLFLPPAESSQKGQHQSAEASRAGKPSDVAAEHGKDGESQHQEGTLHHQMFLRKETVHTAKCSQISSGWWHLFKGVFVFDLHWHILNNLDLLNLQTHITEPAFDDLRD